MPRGGKRTPGKGKKLGRPKTIRPVDANVARRIKERIKAEDLWVQCVALAYKKARDTGNTADLRQCLEYLDDRDLGRCVDTVNHLHDKPIEVNMNLNLAERIASARKKVQR